MDHRVSDCSCQSAALGEIQEIADRLHGVLKGAVVKNERRNYLGEQHRILTRGQALRQAMEIMDPELRHVPWASTLVSTEPPGAPHKAGATVQRERPHSKYTLEGREVTPSACLQSTCLLLSALYEKTPFSDTDIRKKVCADFSTLKRSFRSAPLHTLHGPTSSVQELFAAVKDLDQKGLTQNLLVRVLEGKAAGISCQS